MARGFTHARLSSTETPRLFHTMNAARNALTFWLRGKLVAKRTETWSHESLYPDDEHVEMILTPDPDRKRNDMEIVECKIEVVVIKGTNDVETKSSMRVS